MIIGTVHAGAQDVRAEYFLAGGGVGFLSTYRHLIGRSSVSLTLQFGGRSKELLASMECNLEVSGVHIESIVVSLHEILLSALVPDLVKERGVSDIFL